MTGKEKIIDRIRVDGDAAVQRVRDEAAAAAAAIAAEGAAQAEREAAAVMKEAEAAVQRIVKAADSADELQFKNSLLICRREQIDKTLSMALEKMCNMPESAYFDTLIKMAGAYSGLTGEVLLCSRDLARMPADFVQRLKSAGVDATVSDRSADILGGFILKCGDIEYCADFAAILEEKRDALEDMVNRELFVG